MALTRGFASPCQPGTRTCGGGEGCDCWGFRGFAALGQTAVKQAVSGIRGFAPAVPPSQQFLIKKQKESKYRIERLETKSLQVDRIVVSFELECVEKEKKMTRFSDTAELGALVASEGGVLSCTMEELREMEGAGRLGVHVRSAISRTLAGAGLGHIPRELPTYQHQEVRIYRLGSPMEDIVNAVLSPSDAGDQKLRDAVDADKQEVLNQIRSLVCD